MYSLLRKISLLRLATPFIAGIVAGIYFDATIPVWATFMLTLAIAGLIILSSAIQQYSLRWINGIAVTAGFFIIGLLWSVNNKAVNQADYYGKVATETSYLAVVIDDPPEEKERSIKAVAKVKQVVDKHTTPKNVSGKIQLYFTKSADFSINYGDLILIPYKKLRDMAEPKNPYEFDYRQFMAFKQIHHQAYLKPSEWMLIKRDSGNDWLAGIYKFRDYLSGVLEKYIEKPQSFSIASSLLLGTRETLDFHLIKAYSSTGAMHVLAVSGLHVAILYIIMEKLLFFMNGNRKTELTKALLIVAITWWYALLTGFSPSVQRSAIMFTFITIGRQSKWGYNIYNVLAGSALLQLLFNPFAIMEVGFQLSYLAVAGIVMFQKFFYDLWFIKNKVLDYLWQITCVSFAAQLITFPVGLLYFYQFPSYFFISNLFVIPVSFIIMIAGAALLALHQIPGFAWAVSKILNWLIWFMNESVFATERLPYSLIQGLSVSIAESWLIYIMILLFFAYIHIRNPKIIIAQLAVFTMLLGYNTAENIFQHAQKSIVVYATPKTYAYDFIKGKENILIADKALYENYSQMQFYIMHNWWENDIRSHHHAAFNNIAQSTPNRHLLQHKNYFYFCGKRMVIIDKKLPNRIPDKPLNVDYIILTKNAQVHLNKIKHYYSFNTIIADGNNAAYKLGQWKKDAESENINFRAAINDGAFVANF